MGDGGVSQVRTFTPNFTVVTLKMWAYSPQIAEIGNFWYKFDPLKRFLQNLAWGRVSQVCTLTSNFTAVALKLQPPKSQKLVIFDIYLPQRGISLLAIFTKFGMAERLSRTHKHANFRFYGFNINLPLRKNLGCP